MNNHALLTIERATKRFGGLQALSEISFDVSASRIKGLIGPNGSGKTTLFNIICGFYKATSGRICFRGEDITHLNSYDIACKGISRTFQLVRLFGNMTVLENVVVGCHRLRQTGIVGASLHLSSARKEEKVCQDRALEVLALLGLESKAYQSPASLPLGEQKLVEIARAVAAEPILLLLDEPAGGLSVSEVDKLLEAVVAINGRGIAILVVEHDMRFVQGICHDVVALDHGCKIAEGIFSEIREDPRVIEAYFGVA